MNPLIGKTLVGLKMTTDKKALQFLLSDGTEALARCDADCCSETWVEHLSLPSLGFPATVLAVSHLEMPDTPDSSDHEVTARYGCDIHTDRGVLSIEYRNASNGYYGGWLTWGDERHYGGVHGQNVANGEWAAVTGDF